MQDISNDLSSNIEESRDYVFQIISKARHEEFRTYCILNIDNCVIIRILFSAYNTRFYFYFFQCPGEKKYWIRKFGQRLRLRTTCLTKYEDIWNRRRLHRRPAVWILWPLRY